MTETEPAPTPSPLRSVSTRWSALRLAEPNARGGPSDATIADCLIAGLLSKGADDPVEGIIEGVRAELLALAELHPEHPACYLFELLARRLGVACTLLAFTDQRMPLPPER